MEKTKFLAQAVHEDEICNGQLNMIKAPVGSGKTTWALRHLSKNMESPLGMVYLIDTQNGRDQIVSANSDIAAHFSDVWLDKVVNGWEMFGEVPQEDKIVVMTYAKFGAIAKKYPEFAFGTFDYIICDEIHNLPRFMRFGGVDGRPRHTKRPCCIRHRRRRGAQARFSLASPVQIGISNKKISHPDWDD